MRWPEPRALFLILVGATRLATAGNAAAQAELGAPVAGRVHPHWSSDGKEFWYERFSRGSVRDFIWVDVTQGTVGKVFDNLKLAAALRHLGLAVDPDRLPIDEITKIDSDRWSICVFGRRLEYDPTAGKVRDVGPQPTPADRLSGSRALSWMPLTDEETVAVVMNLSDHIVTVSRVNSPYDRLPLGSISPGVTAEYSAHLGDLLAISDSNKPENFYNLDSIPSHIVVAKVEANIGGTNEGSNDTIVSPNSNMSIGQIQGDLFLDNKITKTRSKLPAIVDNKATFLFDDASIKWSADSRFILAIERVNSAPVRYLYRSKTQTVIPWRYSPNCRQECRDRLHIFDTSNNRDVLLDTPPKECSWFVRDLAWMSNSRALVTLIDRSFQNVEVLSVEAGSGTAKILHKEHSDKFLDVEQSPEKYHAYYLAASERFLWSSEIDGWNHLYLFDSSTGHVRRDLTPGDIVVRDILSIDEQQGSILFCASGSRPGEDPYNIHVCRVGFDGRGLVDLTPASGTHSVQFSPDGKFYLDTYSSADVPFVTELRKVAAAELICCVDDGKRERTLASDLKPVIPFVAKGRDGATDIYGVIYPPRKVPAKTKYPVIEHIYASPSVSSVPHDFRPVCDERSLADLGCYVVQIDGMGTNHRSREFHEMSWQNLADGGFLDRVLWLRTAAKLFPDMDLSRVGIYGSSAGADNVVRALESYSDFYKVGVADAGTYDFERGGEAEYWMNWPAGKCFSQQSPIKDVPNLHGDLLLISEELDRVVDPACTTHMVSELIRNDKPFEMVIIPDADHCEIGSYGIQLRNQFLLKHLAGNALKHP